MSPTPITGSRSTFLSALAAEWSISDHLGACVHVPATIGGVPDALLDRDVVERFRAGDEDAVRDLYRHYGRLVFTVAFRILGDRQLAEDATQQSFLQAWRASSTFDADRDPAPGRATLPPPAALDVQRSESPPPAPSRETAP